MSENIRVELDTTGLTRARALFRKLSPGTWQKLMLGLSRELRQQVPARLSQSVKSHYTVKPQGIRPRVKVERGRNYLRVIARGKPIATRYFALTPSRVKNPQQGLSVEFERGRSERYPRGFLVVWKRSGGKLSVYERKRSGTMFSGFEAIPGMSAAEMYRYAVEKTDFPERLNDEVNGYLTRNIRALIGR